MQSGTTVEHVAGQASPAVTVLMDAGTPVSAGPHKRTVPSLQT